MTESAKEGKITFIVEETKVTLNNFRGSIGMEEGETSQVFVDFDTLEDALNCARAAAAEDKIEIDIGSRYGSDKIKYSSYEVLAFCYDEDEFDHKVWVGYDGKVEDVFGSSYECISALDLHPEVLRSYKRATQSFAKYLDFEDNGEGCCLFSEFLEEELGEDWDELDFIETYRN